MRFQLVVFDLDGTLIDSRQDLAESANLLIAEYEGRALPQAAIVGMVGEGVELLVRRALAGAGLPDLPPGAVARFGEIYRDRMLIHTRPYPGVPTMLARAAELTTLAVVSNKPRAASRAILEGLGLARVFHDVYGGDEPFPRKPDPAGLWHLVEELGTSRADALLVGDSPIDLQTARAGGVRLCLARFGFGFARVTPDMLAGDDLFIDRPEDLLGILLAESGQADAEGRT